MNWYVLHTKPRCEKKAEKHLLSTGINAYCPTRSEIKIWSDRKKKVDVPILPSMLLININDKDINRVFESPLILRYMFWLGKRAVVKQYEIDVLKRHFNESCGFLKNNILNIKVGDSFCLTSLNNEKGIVNKISNNNIWVYLKSIGYSVKLKLA